MTHGTKRHGEPEASSPAVADFSHSLGILERFAFVCLAYLRASRPGLDACVAALEPGDTLVVWRLDRLGRSMQHLVGLVEELLGKGIGFRSLQDGVIDTTTASGELMFNIFSSLAQFERRLIQERTQAGLAAARARGRLGGRRPISPDDPRVVTAKRLHKDRSLSIDHICKTLGISRPTF